MLKIEEEAQKYITSSLKEYDQYDEIVSGVNFMIDAFEAEEFYAEFYHDSKLGKTLKTEDVTIAQAFNNASYEISKIRNLKYYDHQKLLAKFKERGYDIYERFEKAGIDYQAFRQEEKKIHQRGVVKHAVLCIGIFTLPLTTFLFLPSMLALIISLLSTSFAIAHLIAGYEESKNMRKWNEDFDGIPIKISNALNKLYESPINDALHNPEFRKKKLVDYLDPKSEQVQEDKIQENL